MDPHATRRVEPLAPEAPVYVLAAPGTITPRHRLTQALAAGSLLALALRLPPRAAASAFLVTNLNPNGAGSLRAAIDSANTNPGPDVVTFQPGLVGTIPITTQLKISESVQIVGPGPGALSVSGGNTTRVFYLYTNTHVPFTATISGLTVRDGKSTGPNAWGGGIVDWDAVLTLDNVAVISNTSTSGGGGVAAYTGSPPVNGLTVRNSIISGNQAPRGGGVFLYSGSQGVVIQNTQILSNTAAQSGGGIYLYKMSGDFTLEDSTLAGNKALSPTFGGGGLAEHHSIGGRQVIRRTTISGNNSGHNGGGLVLREVTATLTIENSTVSGNQADARGGGIYLVNDTQTALQNSTVVSNNATLGGGGVDMAITTTLPVTNSIIAGNLAPVNRDISGTFQLKYDLVQVTGAATITASSGNVFGLDPLLGPLADNGGPTQTHLPAHNSPALNAGDPAFAPPPATDERGRARVTGGRLDIGAVEVIEELFLPLVRR